MFVSSQGNGVYVSNDGGATFSLTPSSPANVQHMVCDQQGILWATDGSNQNNLRKFVNGSWNAVSAQGVFKTIAINPANAAHIVIGTMSGSICQSFDRGGTWTGTISGQRVAMDIPWLAWTNEGFMSSGDIAFDPSASNKLYFSEGIGVWWTNPSASGGSYSWTSQSRGIEQLVSNDIVTPLGGVPLYLAWDRPIFKIDNPDAYPQVHGPNNAESIVMGWSADYAPDDPRTIVALMNWGGVEQSAVSRDGGTTWNKFTNMPAVMRGQSGGHVASGGRNNFVMMPADVQGALPSFTLDGGNSWNTSRVDGADPSGFQAGYYFHRRHLCADRVNLGMFYLYNWKDRSIYRSADGGASFFKMGSVPSEVWTGFNFKMQTVPGRGGHIYFSAGPQSGAATAFLQRSRDGGATWEGLARVNRADGFGFGKAKVDGGYPTIFIAGYLDGVYGIYRSDDECATWTGLGAEARNWGDQIVCVAGDLNVYGKIYIGFSGTGAAYGEIS